MPELKPCPFCGSTDIKFSLKITGHFDVRYHASMYCNKCHCYGARTLTKSIRHNDYKGRHQIEEDKSIRQQAEDAWNSRADKNKIIVAPMPMAEWLKKELTEYVHKRCMEEL